ncbi:TPA: siderophore ABC transporter substrate-binding protein [Streptococcus agalactiae]
MTKKLIIAILALCTILTTSQAVLAKEKSQTVTIKNNYSVYIKKEKRDKPDNKKQISETLKVPLKPKKVVVFDMGALDTITALGAEKSVIGIPKAKNALSLLPNNIKSVYKAKRYQDVGSLFEPNFEAIARMQPDVVFLGARMASVDNIEKLKEAAPKAALVYAGVDSKKVFDKGVAERVTMLGKIFDQNKKAKTFNKDIAQAVLKLQKTIEKKGKPTALFVMANSGELLTQSPSGRFGWIFSVGGFKAVNENEKLSSHGTPVSYEYIAEKNPNYLFVLDRGATIGQGASSKELFNNDVIKATDAVKNKRVHEVDGKDRYINSGGSRVTLRMIKDVQNFVDNR